MSACPHTGDPEECTCGPGCGCDMELAPALAEPETWPEYELCYSIFDNAPDDTPRWKLRDMMSRAVRRSRSESACTNGGFSGAAEAVTDA